MRGTDIAAVLGVAAALWLADMASPAIGFAQEQQQAAATDASQDSDAAPEPLSEDELEVLVARIALYPDELVGVISGASLFPLQVVEAARFLDAYDKDKSLKPKESWDGSVVSLLNYPEVVRMMSQDLEWTQNLATALTYQQKDVLIAIQQLREEAVAKGIIKSDEKIKVVTSSGSSSGSDNIVIQSTNPETVYVPQYEPEMLYEPDYVPAPISYYPDPYPSYWYPTATFFAGAVTGAVWAAAVDWDDWGVWGGNWDGGDIDIDCNKCMNNIDINGKMNLNDVDWKNVDRSKIKIDKDKLANFDRKELTGKLKANNNNALRNRANEIKKRDVAANRPNRQKTSSDIRKSTMEGLKASPGAGIAQKRPGNNANINRPAAGNRDIKKPANVNRPANVKKPANINRPAGKPKVANKIDRRPSKPSNLGTINRGKVSSVQSNRGRQSMGGGMRGGGGNRAVSRGGGGGGRAMHRGGGGGGRRR